MLYIVQYLVFFIEVKVLLEIDILDLFMISYLIVNFFIYFRLNRKFKYQLEKDLKDKFSVLLIDEYCVELRNNFYGFKFKDGVVKIEVK